MHHGYFAMSDVVYVVVFVGLNVVFYYFCVVFI